MVTTNEKIQTGMFFALIELADPEEQSVPGAEVVDGGARHAERDAVADTSRDESKYDERDGVAVRACVASREGAGLGQQHDGGNDDSKVRQSRKDHKRGNCTDHVASQLVRSTFCRLDFRKRLHFVLAPSQFRRLQRCGHHCSRRGPLRSLFSCTENSSAINDVVLKAG